MSDFADADQTAGKRMLLVLILAAAAAFAMYGQVSSVAPIATPPHGVAASDVSVSSVSDTEAAGLKLQQARTPSLILAVLQFCLVIALLSMWRTAPEYRIFLWTGVYLLIGGVVNCIRFSGSDDTGFFLGVLTIAISESVVAAFDVRLDYWRYLIWPIGILTSIIHLPLPGLPAPRLRELIAPVSVPLMFCALLSLRAIWRGPAALRVLGVFVLLFCFSFSHLFPGLPHIPLVITVAGWQWTPTAVLSTLFGFIVLQTFMRQLIHDRREKLRLAGEFEAARAVQRLLLRDEATAPGFIIEKAYEPAQEVGGDFYQVLPGKDGSVLLVVGDVSGKGLKAAMQVSMIIGALRDISMCEPGEVMAHLNRVLFGRSDGFVTCLCARVREDALAIVNAGHLPPYCGGIELEIPGGLPLGLSLEAEYDERRFAFRAGQRLTFLSDGVVEARDKEGELLGFDRARELSGGTAAQIAAAAQAFGQEDDITVLTVERMA